MHIRSFALAAAAALFATPAFACPGGITQTMDLTWLGGPASIELETPICSFSTLTPTTGGSSFVPVVVPPVVEEPVVEVPPEEEPPTRIGD